MLENRVLDCGIIGSGIAGLAAGIALCRAGHKATIYERSHLKHEVGAAITLCPNANRVLDAWGFDRSVAGSTPQRQIRRVKWDSLDVMYQQSYEHVLGKYGHAFDAFHREDIHQALRKLADGNGAKLDLGRQAVDVDCTEGTIRFQDGDTVTKDIVVIADGIRSRFVPAVTGESMNIIPTKGSVFRTLVPIDRLMKDDAFRKWFDGQPSGLCISFGHKDVYMVTYPCRNGTLMNVALFHPTREHLKTAQGWSHPTTKEDVLKVIDDWPDLWRNIVKEADDDGIKVYRVEQRETIRTMVNGTAIIIGDAAHGMLPTYAQGGAMGVEDAAALEVLLSGLVSSDDLGSRLSLWNELRHPRCCTIQYLSNNRRSFITKDDMSAAEQDPKFSSFYKGPKLPSMDHNEWNEAWNDLFFAYDVQAEAKRALKDGNMDNVKYFGAAAASQ